MRIGDFCYFFIRKKYSYSYNKFKYLLSKSSGKL